MVIGIGLGGWPGATMKQDRQTDQRVFRVLLTQAHMVGEHTGRQTGIVADSPWNFDVNQCLDVLPAEQAYTDQFIYVQAPVLAADDQFLQLLVQKHRFMRPVYLRMQG